MKYEIEVYKGQTIEYDEDYDKFICDISIEDKFSNKKRGSLKDLKKEIDKFIKLNLEFKPFKVIEESIHSDNSVREICGIRSDGKLILKGAYTLYVSPETIEKNYRTYDTDIDNKFKEIANEAYELAKEHKKRRAELISQLKPLDLSKYKNITNE